MIKKDSNAVVDIEADIYLEIRQVWFRYVSVGFSNTSFPRARIAGCAAFRTRVQVSFSS